MPDRHPKRQRKKEAAAARRAAMLAAFQARRRRQRRMLASATLLIVAGIAIVLAVLRSGGPETPQATPSSEESPAAGTPTPAPSPVPIACGGKLPDKAGEKKPSYDKAEQQKFASGKTYLLRLQTTCGQVDIKLATKTSPKTSSSIAFLARKGFYDGLTFHRIVPNFVVQGGDPKGDGTGGPGYKTVEAPPKGFKYTKGVVAMAKAGPEESGTSGSQFFIVSGDASNLTADYAYLGDVVAGMDVVDKIGAVGKGEGPPPEKVFIEKATIVEQ